MARVLIVGLGNPLRSDDGLGPRAAEELRQGPLPPGTEVLVQHQLTPDLAETIRHAKMVLFVDAARGEHPGEIHCQPVDPAGTNGTFTHELTPAAVLALAKQLYGVFPQAVEISIEGASFELGERLSPRVEEKLPALVYLTRELARLGAGGKVPSTQPAAIPQ